MSDFEKDLLYFASPPFFGQKAGKSVLFFDQLPDRLSQGNRQI